MDTLDIAIGRSRLDTSWKNTEITWADFVKRLSKTHRTHETYKDYLSSPKDIQASIKDVGGYVGAMLSGGRKTLNNILHRQLVTLDIDFASSDFWDDFTITFGNAAVLHSTHKHGPAAPRYRLILPLDRPVRPDEYEAIARKIAGILDIELFDPTTFQPNRLMHWPSTSADGEYIFREQKGPWIGADDMLSRYHNWTDISEWPVSSKVGELNKSRAQKQGEPTEKQGIVGEFCRAYTITEAIDEFLADIYEPADAPDRYTFKGGSTAAGIIIYDDKFSFSHHGTDPTSGKLCNAFDLVRLHKFGTEDVDSAPNTPVNQLPSYLHMREFAVGTERVKRAIATDRFKKAAAEFAAPEEVDIDWMANLETDLYGKYKPSATNLEMIFKNDATLRNTFRRDQFAERDRQIRELPWRKLEHNRQYIRNIDLTHMRQHVEKVYGIVAKEKIHDAFEIQMEATAYHPVREFLKGCSWDGTPRLDTMLIDYMGVEDTPFIRAATRKTLVAAIARVMHPGIKFDYVLTLTGEEGVGKSTLFKKLAGEWHSDNLPSMHGREAAEQIQGVWIVEIGELVGLKRTDAETVKSFLSRTEDSYRPAYGIKKETNARQCIFVGTTNRLDFLTDNNGNRRFWPAEVMANKPTKDVFSMTEDEVKQIWGEALHFYNKGEKLTLPDELNRAATKEQESRLEHDDRLGMIEAFLERRVSKDYYEKTVIERITETYGEIPLTDSVEREIVSVLDIWMVLFRKDIRDYNTHVGRQISSLLNRVPGWKKAKGRVTLKEYGKTTYYERVRESIRKEVEEFNF